MKQVIWKYEIPESDKFAIRMPKDAEILTVQADEKTNAPCIWALVLPYNEEEERYFEQYGTGHWINSGMEVSRKYIGTYQILNGKFVGHLFERIN